MSNELSFPNHGCKIDLVVEIPCAQLHRRKLNGCEISCEGVIALHIDKNSFPRADVGSQRPDEGRNVSVPPAQHDRDDLWIIHCSKSDKGIRVRRQLQLKS